MIRRFLVSVFLLLSTSGFLSAQRAVDPAHRYYRLICLVHLTGSGKANDPILPEYVAAGTAVAESSVTAAIAASPNMHEPGTSSASSPAAGTSTTQPAEGAASPATGALTPVAAVPAGPQPMPTPVSAAAPPVARPGILSWSMQKTDDGKMAIVHIVAADPAAFKDILADTRPEIRVFQIGKDSPAAIQAEMRRYKKDFDLNSFEVVAQ